MKVHDRLLRRQAARWAPFVIVVTMAAAAAAPPYSSPGLLTVHEWGTFVSMEGSDGLALEGLHHDEADLPAFVHSRSQDQLRLHATTSKLETPVLYFYTDPDAGPKSVHVRVDFPKINSATPLPSQIPPVQEKNTASAASARGECRFTTSRTEVKSSFTREHSLLREELRHLPELVIPRRDQLLHRQALNLGKVMFKRSKEQLGRSIRIGVRPAVWLRNNGVNTTELFQIRRSDAKSLGGKLFFRGIAPHDRSASLRRND